MGNYWEMKMKRQLFPKTWEIIGVFSPTSWEFAGKSWEKISQKQEILGKLNSNSNFFPILGNYWEMKMKRRLFPKHGK